MTREDILAPGGFAKWIKTRRSVPQEESDDLYAESHLRALYDLLAPRWIPCSEELPATTENCIVVKEFTDPDTGEKSRCICDDRFVGCDQKFGEEDEHTRVTHWQTIEALAPALPPLPAEEV
jgi:hypothetical protein